MTLLICKHQSLEAEHSPEFRYLLSVCVSHARQVFADVELRTCEPLDCEPSLRESKYVLVLGHENVWLTVQTLRRMKETIDGGADYVIPAPVTDFLLDAHEPMYTARDYELLERALFEDGRALQRDTPSHLPVALFSGAVFRALAEQFTLSRLLVEPMLLSDDSAHVRSRAGCFHQFTDYYGEARADLLPYLPAAAGDVLEVGCGRGHTGKLIQDRLGCRVTGVEKHPEIAADASRNLWRVIVGDVLSVDLDGRYDAVVASELFEHLSDPDTFLLKMKPLLKPEAPIVLSVPNVGHYSVVEDLLAGRWDYVPTGLLCYTHLRFFTRRTLVDWMSRLGFRCTVVAQTTDLPERFRQVPSTFECDLESLRTKGFYVILRL